MLNNICPDKPVLLFSTGLDSFIVKFLEKIPDSQCIFADMGTAENAIEKERIDRFFPDVKKVELPLADYALSNNIIPFRNHMLAFIGFQFSNQVTFAFTAGDTTRDKDYVFKAQMEGAASYFGGVPDKIRVQGPYKLLMQYKAYTKGELVKAFIEQGGSGMDLLVKSTSCYAGSDFPCGCGKCRSCLRKFVAIAYGEPDLAEIMRKETEIDPIHYLKDFYEESLTKLRSAREIKEIEFCLKKMF